MSLNRHENNVSVLTEAVRAKCQKMQDNFKKQNQYASNNFNNQIKVIENVLVCIEGLVIKDTHKEKLLTAFNTMLVPIDNNQNLFEIAISKILNDVTFDIDTKEAINEYNCKEIHKCIDKHIPILRYQLKTKKWLTSSVLATCVLAVIALMVCCILTTNPYAFAALFIMLIVGLFLARYSDDIATGISNLLYSKPSLTRL